MKILSSTPALAAILGLALAGAPLFVQAQTTTTTNSDTVKAPADPTAVTAKSTAPATKNYSGSITSIDASSVTVTSTKKTLTMAIAPTTKFKKDKMKATLADFAVGDEVTGSYTKDATGAMTAYSIHKKKMKAAAASTAPATPAAQ